MKHYLFLTVLALAAAACAAPKSGKNKAPKLPVDTSDRVVVGFGEYRCLQGTEYTHKVVINGKVETVDGCQIQRTLTARVLKDTTAAAPAPKDSTAK